MSKTFFSTPNFVEAWTKSGENKDDSLAISFGKLSSIKNIYAIQTNLNFGFRYISLGPAGLYAGLEEEDMIDDSAITSIVNSIKTVKTAAFVWNVRFDDLYLAKKLSGLGLTFQQSSTHILPLQKNYESIFSNYSSSTRNHIRKAERRGVTVRDATTADDVMAYHQIYTELFRQKGIYSELYSSELLINLMKIGSSAKLLIAECDGKIVAGGFFFIDGCSVFYWQGAANREYSSYYPSCAIFDRAIQWACTIDSTFFNFGASANIGSLEKFKSSWGANPELNWNFKWRNPLLSPLYYLRKRTLKNA
jgi:Acetyltransferase (GNAT) domain